MFSKLDLFFTIICNITLLCFIMSGKMPGFRPKMSKQHFQKLSALGQMFFSVAVSGSSPICLGRLGPVLSGTEIHLHC